MARRKSKEAEKQPRRTTKGAKAYSGRMLPKIRMLLSIGADEHDVAAYLGVSTELLLTWAKQHFDLAEALDARDEIRRWDHERNVGLAKELAARGASDAEIAQAFRVSARTLSRWRRQYPDFDEALRLGVEMQVQVAERTLFQIATGYVYDEERTVPVKGALLKVRETKQSLPDKDALRLFLIAHKPEKYSQKAKPEAGADEIGELARAIDEAGVQSVVPVEKDAG